MVNEMARGPDFGILLGLASQVFVDQLRQHLDERGFSDLGSAYGYVLRALADEPLRPNELASRLGITPQGATKVVGEMVDRGYVELLPDPRDGRAKRVQLASRGKRLLAAARRFHAAYERRLRQRLGERAADTLRELLDAMVRAAGVDPDSTVLRAV